EGLTLSESDLKVQPKELAVEGGITGGVEEKMSCGGSAVVDLEVDGLAFKDAATNMSLAKPKEKKVVRSKQIESDARLECTPIAQMKNF
ncbi:hypothetical protein A2U01_0064116, partial [Trifolium medium]|nr:hypothetical protein [Trifolium medium]